MDKHIETTVALSQLEQIVEKYFLVRIKDFRIFAFCGPLGAGKTTTIKTFLRALGVKDIVTSPTFTYVKIYKTDCGKIIYHFDLYRLESLNQFIELGFDEYLLQEKSVAVIEWPEVIKPFLVRDGIKKSVCWIRLQYCEDDDQQRILTMFDGQSSFLKKD